MIVDDRVLRVGSSNMNNRSLRLDTECDVAIDAGAPCDPKLSDRIRRFRDSLLAEHLGAEEAEVARRMEQEGSLIRTIEKLRGPGRSCALTRSRTSMPSSNGWRITRCWTRKGRRRCSIPQPPRPVPRRPAAAPAAPQALRRGLRSRKAAGRSPASGP
ncbi:hypothetical protein ACFQU7_26200 [Pseudoroseomonas wenyumeiae]